MSTSTPREIAGMDVAQFDSFMLGEAGILRGILKDRADDWEGSNDNHETFEASCEVASKLGIFEIVDGVLGSEGVGFITPYSRYNHVSQLSPPVTVSINPIDGLEAFRAIVTERKNNRSGVVFSFAVRVAGKVIAAYSVDLYGGRIFRTKPYDNRLYLSYEDGTEVVWTPSESSFDLSSQALLLYGDRGQYDDLLELLRQPAQGTGTFFSCEDAPLCTIEALRDLLEDMGAALAMPASMLTVPWIEWPLLRLAEVAGVRLFRSADGVLRELPLSPVTGPDMKVSRNYTLLFVRKQYVEQLRRRTTLQLLTQ